MINNQIILESFVRQLYPQPGSADDPKFLRLHAHKGKKLHFLLGDMPFLMNIYLENE
jgi:hypothetical protein